MYISCCLCQFLSRLVANAITVLSGIWALSVPNANSFELFDPTPPRKRNLQFRLKWADSYTITLKYISKSIANINTRIIYHKSSLFYIQFVIYKNSTRQITKNGIISFYILLKSSLQLLMEKIKPFRIQKKQLMWPTGVNVYTHSPPSLVYTYNYNIEDTPTQNTPPHNQGQFIAHSWSSSSTVNGEK